jgi:uncharacterized protein
VIVVVADTSGLLAALDDDHPAQESAQESLRAAGTVVISPELLSELDHVGRRALGRSVTCSAIDDIADWARTGRAVLPKITAHMLRVAQALRAQYSDLDLDLADAVNIAVAAEYRTNVLLTLDRRDYRAVRPLTEHPAFTLLPDDLP